MGMLTKPWKREESRCREVDDEVERRRLVGGCGAVEDVLFRASWSHGLIQGRAAKPGDRLARPEDHRW